MREYEITLVIQPQMEEEARGEFVQQFADTLSPNAADEEKPVVDQWGMRRLAYTIKKHREGYYVVYDAKVDPARIPDIERGLQYNEDVLRYLFVRKSS